MMIRTLATTLAATAAGLTMIAAAAAPAAAETTKPIQLTVSARTLPTPESRLCVPKASVGRKKDKTVPATMCHTRAEWEAQGVMIKLKS